MTGFGFRQPDRILLFVFRVATSRHERLVGPIGVGVIPDEKIRPQLGSC